MTFIKVHFISDDDEKVGWLINVNHIIEIFEFADGSCGIKTSNTCDEFTPTVETYEEVLRLLKCTGRCWG